MANLHKATVKEAHNFEVSSCWNVKTRLTISEQTHVAHQVTKGTGTIFIYSDSEVYMRWDLVATDTISANNDMIIPAKTLVEWKVPLGIDEDAMPYVHFKQVTSAVTSYLRIVEG